MSNAGFKRPGIECINCKKPFSLALGTGAMKQKEIDDLPDPFEATCPLCGKIEFYQRSAIGIFVTV
jgi:hypothetical protein